MGPEQAKLTDRQLMELAIQEARRCEPEDDQTPRPKVGAVVARDGVLIGKAYRGELKAGEHAEFTLLERKLAQESLAGSTLFATLEPCTVRGEPKIPCARRVVERKVGKVYMGVLDPNRAIQGEGYQILRAAGIDVAFFDPDLMPVLEELNRGFFRAHRPLAAPESLRAGPQRPGRVPAGASKLMAAALAIALLLALLALLRKAWTGATPASPSSPSAVVIREGIEPDLVRVGVSSGLHSVPSGNVVTFAGEQGRVVASREGGTGIVVEPPSTLAAGDLVVTVSGRQVDTLRYALAPLLLERIPLSVIGLSDGAREVAFCASDGSLVAGDDNRAADVFVYTRASGAFERVSISSSGEQGTVDRASAPLGAGCHLGNRGITPNGRFVVFTSNLTGLVAGDINKTLDVFVRDRDPLNRTTTLVSRNSKGHQGNAPSSDPVISSDGRWVAFQTMASNLDLASADTNNLQDVYLHDRETRTTVRVSHGPGGLQGDGRSEVGAINGDGRVVVFSSDAGNFEEVPNFDWDIFAFDRDSGEVTLVTVAADGGASNGSSRLPLISADGHLVAFSSTATNLVEGDTNAAEDAFVRDLRTGVTKRVSLGAGGRQVSEDCQLSGLSADGRVVTFQSRAARVVPPFAPAEGVEYARDRATDATYLLSLETSGKAMLERTGVQCLSPDGRYVVILQTLQDGNSVTYRPYLTTVPR